MPISDFTAYPIRGSATFSEDGDAFVAHMPVFIGEVNDAVAAMNADTAAAAASASAASASAASASASATAAGASLAAVSSALGLTVTPVSGTAQTATAGKLYVLQNAALTTVTVADGAPGDVIGIKVANGRTDNLVSGNIEGQTSVELDMPNDLLLLTYVDNTSKWREML